MPKIILPAAILSLMMFSAAYAASPATGSQLTAPSDVVQIKKEGKDHYGNQRDWGGDGGDNWRGREANRYEPDNRYSNWHRYSYRPDDWNDRGCAAIGPLWYCP
jgi:hypothetical protein